MLSTLYNRAKESGHTIAQECLKKSQFSGWNYGILPRLKEGKKYNKEIEEKTFNRCVELASKVIESGYVPVNRTVNSFYSGDDVPKWAKDSEGNPLTPLHFKGLNKFLAIN